MEVGLILTSYRITIIDLDKTHRTSESVFHFTDYWGFLFYITLENGFQLRTIKRFCNTANEKRQNNKSEFSKKIKVEEHVIKQTLLCLNLTSSKRILVRVLK